MLTKISKCAECESYGGIIDGYLRCRYGGLTPPLLNILNGTELKIRPGKKHLSFFRVTIECPKEEK